jgi:AraC family transcriptional regulator of adaptative response/methylated-DNA-[protein]-cysteine methyltransferase
MPSSAATVAPSSGSDYSRIEKAIRYLDAHAAGQPSLDEVAQHLGLSPAHFHRLFHRWAGVTPKDFLQLATLESARSMLRASRPVLESALAAGLSGPSRLHDLCITMEAMTPGQYRRGGADVTIRWGMHETNVGQALIALTGRGICALYFANSGQDPASLLHDLRSRWPRSRLLRNDPATAAVAQEISRRMLGQPVREPLSVLFRGTPFQLKVWQALMAIPPGAVTTYGDIAARAGRPAAHRAAATAIGANEISYLIPCHRVLRTTGAMGGYRWGEPRKRALLALEHPAINSRTPSDAIMGSG